jgi:hypothetical protein
MLLVPSSEVTWKMNVSSSEVQFFSSSVRFV